MKEFLLMSMLLYGVYVRHFSKNVRIGGLLAAYVRKVKMWLDISAIMATLIIGSPQICTIIQLNRYDEMIYSILKVLSDI